MPSVKTDYIVTLPCDGPALPPDFITRMLLALNNACLPDAIAVAHDGTRMQPVHALIPMTLMTSLENFLSKGHRKVAHWYSEQVVFLVDFSDQPNAFFNINKKEQLIEHNSDDN
jgi:molybdopterin-guanine dinucleotide biosynthesis protein A